MSSDHLNIRALNSLYGFLLFVMSIVLLLALWTSPASAGTILVVARQDAPVNSLSQAEVAALFLGQKLSNISLTPIDQHDGKLRERFYLAVAGMSPSSVRAYWAKRVFTGRGRPPPQMSAKEAMQALTENPAAITYMPDNLKTAGNKVLLVIEIGEVP